MKCKLLLLSLILLPVTTNGQSTIKATAQSKFALVIHGGAGNPGNLSPGKEQAYKQSLKTALTVGYNVLIRGGTAVDAVEKVVTYLEDDSLFNAGGEGGQNELDAAIMDGNNSKMGVVKDITTIKNPVQAARAVMDKTNQVVLSGHLAEEFAAKQGLPTIQPAVQYHKVEAAKVKPEKSGTVGAVALDIYGHLAAATSTTGAVNEKNENAGNRQQMGGAAYANDSICAISYTGRGEYYARFVMVTFVTEEMEQKHTSLQNASSDMINNKLPATGRDGGLIGVDRQGNITMPFNTPSMLRGYIKSGGEPWVAIYR